MIRGAEFISCLCVAAAAHLGLWVLTPGTGATSSGAGGEALTSMEASSASVARMVAAWERPPELAQTAARPAQPQAPDAPQLAALPRMREAPVRAEAPAPPRAAPAEAAPAADIQTLPPPPLPAPRIAAQVPALPRPAAPVPDAPPKSRPRAQPAPQDPAPVQPARAQAPASAQAPRIDTAAPPPPPERFAPQRSARPRSRPAPPAPRQRAAAEASSQAAPAQRAAGAGARLAQGDRGRDEVSTGDPAARRAALARWGAKIRRSIERGKRYPRGARGSGTVTVQLSVSRGGALQSVRVVASSGVAALDGAAVAAVRRARLPAAPEGLSVRGYRFNLPVAFRR